MSSKTEFICNHCGKRIVDQSINPDFQGFCITENGNGKKVAVTNLFCELDGPHICLSCVNLINERREGSQ